MSASKVVVVTGGTFGIGRDISVGLARRGHRVVALGIEAAQAASTAVDSVSAFRSDVAESMPDLDIAVLETDVTDAGQVDEAIRRTVARHGRIDALVNNAAIGPLGTVATTDESTFDAVLAVNVKGPYLCMRAVIPHLRDVGGGAIVNIGSGAGWGKPGMAAYSASKGGLFALSAATAYDEFHAGIRVNTVVPGGGGIRSGMTIGRVGGDPTQIDPNAIGSAAGRPVSGDDVANAVAYLVSDEAEAVSGTVIDIGCFSHQGGPVRKKASA